MECNGRTAWNWKSRRTYLPYAWDECEKQNRVFLSGIWAGFSNGSVSCGGTGEFQADCRSGRSAAEARAKELLEYGREKGLGMAVATSSRRAYAEDMLAQAGIDGYFDGFVFGDMVKNAKPDPEIYLAACRELGVNPSNALALEDAPNGIRSAYAAGLYPVMIPDLVEPDDEIRRMAYRVLHSLYDVRELLSRCLSQ